MPHQHLPCLSMREDSPSSAPSMPQCPNGSRTRVWSGPPRVRTRSYTSCQLACLVTEASSRHPRSRPPNNSAWAQTPTLCCQSPPVSATSPSSLHISSIISTLFTLLTFVFHPPKVEPLCNVKGYALNECLLLSYISSIAPGRVLFSYAPSRRRPFLPYPPRCHPATPATFCQSSPTPNTCGAGLDHRHLKYL